jgi:hypothetical protein
MESIYSVLEHAHLTEMQDSLRRKMQDSQKSERMRGNGLRGSVLGMVAGENYDRAKVDIQDYVRSRRDFPVFQSRVERHVQHCSDLIQAIQTKRNFPGLGALSLSKQQEIHEKVLEHFEELKQNLKHIEKVERDHKLTDVRSTVWFLKTLSYVVGALLTTTFIVDLKYGLFSSAITVIDTAADNLSSWFVNLLY